MSQQTLRGAAHPHLLAPMRGRDPEEPGRSATPLELFFDLVVVVSVALAAERLHHAIIEGVGLEALFNYALVFFAIWLSWVNFTWFASAYDTDDVAFRLSVFVITTGALVLAAGVPAAFDARDFTLAITGYVIMRVALVTQWIRVSRDDLPRRETARRYAIGITACQLGWVTLFVVPEIWPYAWLILVPAELLVPVWAERAEPTTFHREHITERYGLFMIIVLGESVLAASLAIQTVINGEGLTGELLAVIAGSLLTVYSMWWVYFARPEERLLEDRATAFVWSYLHLPIFGSAAAVGAGLVVAIEVAAGHADLDSVVVGRLGRRAAGDLPLEPVAPLRARDGRGDGAPDPARDGRARPGCHLDAGTGARHRSRDGRRRRHQSRAAGAWPHGLGRLVRRVDPAVGATDRLPPRCRVSPRMRPWRVRTGGVEWICSSH